MRAPITPGCGEHPPTGGSHTALTPGSDKNSQLHPDGAAVSRLHVLSQNRTHKYVPFADWASKRMRVKKSKHEREKEGVMTEREERVV